jgi:hypothetical protein
VDLKELPHVSTRSAAPSDFLTSLALQTFVPA